MTPTKFRALAKAAFACLQRARKLVPRWRTWGIASRLTLGFVSVAVLAAAANLIVEKGASIAAPPRPAPPRVVATPVPISTPAAPEVTAPAVVLSSEELLFALDRYDQALRVADETATAESLERYESASKQLERAANKFSSQAREIADYSSASMRAVLKKYVAAGDARVRHSSERRGALTGYAETLQAMKARVNASLDAAFRIFGRIVARQSLVEVAGNLDAVRDSFSAFVRGERDAGRVVAELESAEAALVATLEKNEKGLRRAEGAAWFESLSGGVNSLRASREILMQSSAAWQRAETDYASHGAKLRSLIPATIRAGETLVSGVPASQPMAVAEMVPEQAESAAAAEQDTTAASVDPIPNETPAANRAIVAWISIGVLALLSLIGIATVRSVVTPVRRLISASTKIAAGEQVVVPRGGIKELDMLAVAFNRMAHDLSVARSAAADAQQRLEAKVEQRTRQLQELAELDPLTGLPNRRHLFVLLNAALERAKLRQRAVGVFFLDVDNFKNINDSIGHAFGDAVLTGIARRLEEASRSIGFAARLGGDEFTLVVDDAANLEDIEAAGVRFIEAFLSPIEVSGRELIVSVSVGASAFPDHEQTAEGLLRAADAALFAAKAEGKSRLSLFTPDLLAAASAKFNIEQGLRRAIERGEFELFFQPEVSTDNLQTALVEALIRWRMPDGSYVSPGEFLAVAEESGLIIEISDWVLRTAVEKAAHWHHGEWPEARVAVNVSPRQLLDCRFVQRVEELLHEHRLPARCLEIELTETVLQTGPAVIEQLRRLRALGVPIALDDFGTGYSTLGSLEQLPLTRVKLDRSLIESIDTNPRSAAIVRAIVGLCKSLGLDLTAEGIERREQFEQLLGHRNLYLQGYLLSRPMSEAAVLGALPLISQRAQELVLLSRLSGGGIGEASAIPRKALTSAHN